MGLAFKLLKKACKIGDRVIITSSTGTSEGVIIDIDDVEVALKLDDGGFLTTRGDDIVAMKTVDASSLNKTTYDSNKDCEFIEPRPQSLTPADVDKALKNTDFGHENNDSPSPHHVPIIIESEEEKKDNKEEETNDHSAEPTETETINDNENWQDTERTSNEPQKRKTISLDELLSMQWKGQIWKRQTYRKMLSAIEKIGDYRNENELNKSLPQKGQISQNANGIIIDSISGNKYFYSPDDLLLPKHFYGTSVYFIKEKGGLKDLLPARKFSDIIVILENMIKNEKLGNDPKLPIIIVKALLRILPDNLILSQLCNNLEDIIYNFAIDTKPVQRKLTASEKKSNFHTAYLKAKQLTSQKRHEESLPYYLEAIANGDKIESSIPDAASAYLALYKQAQKSTEDDAAEKAEKWRLEGIEFMRKNRNQLPNKTETINMLENFYYSIRDYDSYFEILPKLMRNVKNDLIKWSTYMNKKASALIAVKRYDEAQQTISDAIKANPDNVGAQRIQEVLNDVLNQLNEALEHDDAQKVEQIQEELEKKIGSLVFSVIKDADLGIFITQTLDEYTEMEGLPEIVKVSQDYTEQTLRTIRNRIGEAGKSRPAERAKLILTEVKLMQMLDMSDDRKTIHGEMAQYCQAMAELMLYQNEPDAARFYYDQSFALEHISCMSTDRYICVYLQTLSYTPIEILGEIFKTLPPVEDMVNQVLTGKLTPQQWEIIITLLLYNKDVVEKIVPCLYRNEQLRQQSLELMDGFSISQPIDVSLEEFKKCWDNVCAKRRNDRQRVSNQIKSLIESCTKLEDVSTNIRTTLDACRSEEWLSKTLDKQRIDAIMDTVLSPVKTYIASKGFTNKFNARNNINSQIKAIQDDIKRKPTKLSFEAILPLLSHIHQLVEDAFNTVELTSKPTISISLPADETVIERGNMVSLQVKVANDENSAPINNVTVEIITTNGVLSDMASTEETGIQIEGGKEHIFKRRIKVNDDVIHNEGTSVNIVCHYRDREGAPQDTKPYACSLTLYSRENYIDIENPYKCGAPLSSTDSTFKGRSSDIQEVVNEIKKDPGYQVIIYGQKRCGKSSVLTRIKAQLEAAGYFCIYFSLDMLAKKGNEFTFYHKILQELHTDLTQLKRHANDPKIVERWGNEIPMFDLPDITDFEKIDPYNPANTFVNFLKEFHSACENIPKWKECRMVLMIDEFTAIYTGVENKRIDPSIMKQWKAITQNQACIFSVVLVGQDVTPTFLDKSYAANAFQILTQRRLTYLPKKDAIDLVVEPMTAVCSGQSPYIGKAVERIIDYTSCNPFYIQKMCSRLVNYMNDNKLKKVTEADIDDLAHIMLAVMSKSDFDNLINPGEEEEDNPEYQQKKNDIMRVLIALAKLSNDRGYDYCSNNDIEGLSDKAKQEVILKELYNREVLAMDEGNYKIHVRLFKEWLLRQ